MGRVGGVEGEGMNEQPRIEKVYTFANGMVMVFDQYGQQMPDYQGRAEDVLPKIKAVYAGAIDGAAVWK